MTGDGDMQSREPQVAQASEDERNNVRTTRGSHDMLAVRLARSLFCVLVRGFPSKRETACSLHTE